MLGDELEALHPHLSDYFSLIPVGKIGRGRGVFATVGTPRRWLYPVLAVLGRLGVTVRRVLGVPAGLPLPRVALEAGAFAIRTETELVLKSRWVLPERLLDAGYRFRYPELRPALDAIVAERRAA